MKYVNSKLNGVLIALLCAACATRTVPPALSEYEQDLQELSGRLSALENSPSTNESQELKAKLLFERGALSGNHQDLRSAVDLLNATIAGGGERPQALLLRAYLNYKIHRFTDARADVQRLARLPSSPRIQNNIATLQNDLAFNSGHYREARRHYERAVREDKNWRNLSRLANYAYVTGQWRRALDLYQAAKELLTDLEMKDYAWIELQQAIIHLERENYPSAMRHLQAANETYSGYWLIEEHMAEVSAKMGLRAQAIALYQKVIRQTGNPEFLVALAEIIEPEQPQQAAQLRARAEARINEQLALLPEAAGGHAIDFFLDFNPLRALELARDNLKSRAGSPEAKLQLARALHRNQQPQLARKLLCEVKNTALRSRDLLDFEESSGFRCSATGS